ncbi:MAG: phosphatase PAP2 family protein [Planctomycetaceae bacterium]|jgi:hypothetical protein|nr:phosphatase PAP2 family protein [Planctomycetaceae bacterium]
MKPIAHVGYDITKKINQMTKLITNLTKKIALFPFVRLLNVNMVKGGGGGRTDKPAVKFYLNSTYFNCYTQTVLKFSKLNARVEQREAVVQGQCLPPIPTLLHKISFSVLGRAIVKTIFVIMGCILLGNINATTIANETTKSQSQFFPEKYCLIPLSQPNQVRSVPSEFRIDQKTQDIPKPTLAIGFAPEQPLRDATLANLCRPISHTPAVSSFPKLNTESQQRETVVQRRSLLPVSALKFKRWSDVKDRQFTADQQYSRRPFYTSLQKIGEDHKNYYSFSNLYYLGLATGFHAVLSNTSVDQNFRDWYQDDMRTSSTDRVSRSLKIFGEGTLWIPVFGVTAGVYCFAQKYTNNYFADNFVGDLSVQTIRSYLVGTPTLLLGQFMLGCSRPREFRSYHSAWRPFRDTNSFSGHAFIGATPFLVAAQMTDRLWLKSFFYVCSTFAGISRINDDSHYLSQVLLGWFIAHLSVSAVCKTESAFANNQFKVFPIADSKNIGIGISFSR